MASGPLFSFNWPWWRHVRAKHDAKQCDLHADGTGSCCERIYRWKLMSSAQMHISAQEELNVNFTGYFLRVPVIHAESTVNGLWQPTAFTDMIRNWSKDRSIKHVKPGPDAPLIGKIFLYIYLFIFIYILLYLDIYLYIYLFISRT